MRNKHEEAGKLVLSDRSGELAVTHNAVRADLLTADERLAEIAEVLAVGLTRLRARQSSLKPADPGESSLDCAAHQSGHANVLNEGGME